MLETVNCKKTDWPVEWLWRRIYTNTTFRSDICTTSNCYDLAGISESIK